MAENESLDLISPRAWRWKPVLEAALKGESSEKVSALARQALLRSIGKTMDQFARSGVSIADFLSQRHSDRELRKLASRTLNDPFAPGAIIDLLVRHRDEWKAMVAERRRLGFRWARVLDPARTPLERGFSHASA